MALNNLPEETAKHAWKMSGEYVALALQHLREFPCKDKSSEKCFDSNAESLRVKFLFPFIKESAQEALLQARQHRWMLTLQKAEHDEVRTVATAHEVEQGEARFLDASKTIRNHLRFFSSVQQAIIREHYLLEI